MTDDAETGLPPAPPGYRWAQPKKQPPPWKPPLWLKVVTIFWAGALVAGGLYYSLHGKSTVRAQTTITQAQPVVDRAIADVTNAAGRGPVVAMSSFKQTGYCQITPFREGVDYQRTVTFFGGPDDGAALLRKIAAGLPSKYHADASASGTPSLYADAGDFVAVIGAVKSAGQVIVRATTGCRPMGGTPTSVTPPSTPSADISAVLSALHVHASSLARTQVVCGNGRVLVTDSAVVPPSEMHGSLPDAASRLSPSPAISTDNVFAYRSSRSDVAVVEDASGVTISSTTHC